MNAKTIAKWAVIVPLFLIPFLALYISSDLFFPFITGKNFLFRILVEIALVGYVVLVLADARYRPQWSWVLASFALLVLWMLGADALAVNSHKAIWSNFERMDGFVTLAHVFALFLVAGSVLSVDKLWRNWWMTFIGASAIVTLHGIAQWLCIGNECGAVGRPFAVHQSTTRLDATLGNSEYLAGFILLAIAVTLWQAFESKGKGLRNGLFALAVLQVLVLFGTGTRGTFIALIAAAVVGGLLWLFELGKKGRRGALIFLAGVLVFAGGFYAVRNTAFIQESPNLSRFANISLSSLDTRFAIWDMALEGIEDKPVTGWGHEGFNYVFNTYYNPELYGQEQWFDRAHNIYLDWAIAGGIPALLIFLILGGAAVISVYRSRELKSWERVLILSALIAYAIQGMAVFDNLFTYIPIAMLLAYIYGVHARPVRVIEKLPEVKGVMLDAFVAPLALIAALFLIYMVNIPTYVAGKELIDAITPNNRLEVRIQHFESALSRNPFASQEIREQLLGFTQQVVSSDATDDVKAKAVTMAIEEMQREIERAPKDARLYVLYATFLRSVGQFETSRAAAATARSLSPHKQNIIVEQGLIEWDAGNPKDALAFFEEALALTPDRDELVTYVATGHIINGDTAGAKQILLDHFGTTTVNSMAIALAYQQQNNWNDIIPILSLRYQEQSTAESGYQLAIAYARAGRIIEAREQVRAVMQEFPNAIQQGTALMRQLGG